jgi:hypothetical protein
LPTNSDSKPALKVNLCQEKRSSNGWRWQPFQFVIFRKENRNSPCSGYLQEKTMIFTRNVSIALFLAAVIITTYCVPGMAQDEQLPEYLQDRGTGVPLSQFGTYVREGEIIIYPFFEYYHDNDIEYSPSELGFGLDQEFRGKYRASEGLIFVGYGITHWLAAEFELAVITASLEKALEDPSNLPPKLKESGLGDVEGQIRARVLRENETRPEIFTYFEITAPFQKDKVLIGTQDWEFKYGLGFTKGFSFGTMTLRAALDYSREEESVEGGEYALEYLKRISPKWRIYVGVEGSQVDEVELIKEAQWTISDHAFIKLNNAFGVTSKATDWAPEIGIVFHFD